MAVAEVNFKKAKKEIEFIKNAPGDLMCFRKCLLLRHCNRQRLNLNNH